MIQIKDLSIAFEQTEVLKHINLSMQSGEILGLVGESGSGKSVTALTIMGLISNKAAISSGSIVLEDHTLVKAGKPINHTDYQKLQGKEISMVFQEPMTSLNPTMKIGRQVEEVLVLHTSMNANERKTKVLSILNEVGLSNPDKIYESYPHELSGGMRQRVMIAMAVILKPKILIADEPTTALDVTIQSQIIALLKELNQKYGTAILFITHDLNLARRICNRIAVMKDGSLIEQGDTDEIFTHPSNEYTKMLIHEMPTRNKRRKTDNEISDHSEASDKILEVSDLNIYYKEASRSFFTLHSQKKCVGKDISFSINKGEILGLVGESGCGKTSLSRAILGINTNYTGCVTHYSKHPQMIFQDPYSSLNPSKSIGWLLCEALKNSDYAKENNLNKDEINTQACEMLEKVGLSSDYYNRMPHQLSGGQRQRVSIGIALISHPSLVIADEPLSALDVTIQSHIMDLMLSLQKEMGLSYLFISHDINVIYQMCDRIMVMKDGHIIEKGKTTDIFEHPKEPYTKMLLAE